MYKAMTFLVGMTWCLALCAPAGARTIYVDVDATGSNRGISWAHAYTSLSLGISRAAAGTEVWVAEGTYGAITLKTGVKVYGGFAATETSASQSDPEAHVTYITKTGGDRPVTSIGNDANTVLRGFYITGGYLGLSDRPKMGTGMYLEDSNAMVVRCVFAYNTADNVVAGTVANRWGSPTFVNCKFYANDGGWGCGAFYNDGFGAPTLVNCLFYENVVMYEGGAVCNNLGSSTFINCTFADNEATNGRAGAVYDYAGDAVFRNCIFWDNTAQFPGTDGIVNSLAAPSPSTVTYSDVEGGWGGTGNIDADPVFVNAAADNYRLAGPFGSLSPCKDAGNDADLPPDTGDLDWDANTTELVPFDLSAVDARIFDGTVDMGAYEWKEASSQQ